MSLKIKMTGEHPLYKEHSTAIQKILKKNLGCYVSYDKTNQKTIHVNGTPIRKLVYRMV